MSRKMSCAIALGESQDDSNPPVQVQFFFILLLWVDFPVFTESVSHHVVTECKYARPGLLPD